MWRRSIPVSVPLVAALLWACGGEQQAGGSADTTARDLSLAPAESVAALNDRPQAQQPQAQIPSRPTQPRQTTPRTGGGETPRQETRPAPAPMSLAAGTVVELAASDTITSRTNKAGDPVTATVREAIRDAQGRVVVPAGAVFHGTIAEIKPAPNPGAEGTLRLAFDQVSFGGKTYAASAMSDSLGTELQGRGVSTGDAAKVGVGAAAGAVAGKLIGKNAKGAIIGGVVGAAAGAGVAAATKDQDIVLPAGGRIRLVLQEPLVLRPVS